MSRGYQEAANPGGTRLDDDIGDTEERKPIYPEEYKDEHEFLAYVIKEYTLDAQADKHNMDQAKEDLRFIYVDQWDPKTRQEREDAGRPCITVNTLPQFLGQVVGDRRLNKTQIKVIPDHNGTVVEAQVRSGLIRSIENYSDAERIYDQCCEDAAGCGISNFQVELRYAYNDVFNQDIFFAGFDNPMAVVWDRLSKDPTGRDARHCFSEDTIPRDVYTREYPDAPIPTSFVGGFDGINFGEWVDGDDVKIVAYWRMKTKPAKFAMLQDGKIVEVEPGSEETILEHVMVDPDTGGPMIRDGERTYACRYLLTSFAVLEGPYELPLDRLPVIKVSGRVGRVGTKQYRFGLIRWARDPSLMRNYWRSIAVETLAMAPKAQWLADSNSVKNREEEFRNAHLTGNPLLVYNTGKLKPERVDPPELPVAVLNEATMNNQDIKDTTGMQDASLGIRSNEVSGKAIMARQREGDVATITYHDNLNLSIQEAGRVANQLIPLCYDTVRIVRTLGPDDTAEFVTINDPLDDSTPNITNTRYDVQVVTGPSYTTQRMEGAEMLLEMVKVFPDLVGIAGDVIVEAQDIPGGEKIVKRLKKMLPAAQAEEQEKQAEQGQGGEQQQVDPMQAMQAQMAQQQLEAQAQQIQLQLQEQQAKVAQAQAQAAQAAAQAKEAEFRMQEAEARLHEARAKAAVAQDEIQFNRSQRAVEIHAKANPPQSSNGANGRGGAPRRSDRPRPQKG